MILKTMATPCSCKKDGHGCAVPQCRVCKQNQNFAKCLCLQTKLFTNKNVCKTRFSCILYIYIEELVLTLIQTGIIIDIVCLVNTQYDSFMFMCLGPFFALTMSTVISCFSIVFVLQASSFVCCCTRICFSVPFTTIRLKWCLQGHIQCKCSFLFPPGTFHKEQTTHKFLVKDYILICNTW